MKYISIVVILFALGTPKVLFDFNKSSEIEDWIIVNDDVMGGKSDGSIKLNESGHGVFEGDISLENNGGFSSVRYQIDKTTTKEYEKIVLTVKGDGKNYQFRIKANTQDYSSYINTFSTSGEWQKVEIALTDMYPSFRGRKLNLPNFANESIEEITFLIGNKKKEHFKLLIDKIELH